MQDEERHIDTEALAQILEGEAHHFHHQLHAPTFSQPRVLKRDEVDDVDDDDDEEVDVHALDIPNVGDDTGGEEEMDLALGDIGTPEMDTPARTSGFGRPPSIRKGESIARIQPSLLSPRLAG